MTSCRHPDLETFRRLYDVPGLAVSVFQGNGEMDLWCSGTSSTNGAPVTPDTMFRIYSVSKLLTACASMHLLRQGGIRLNESLDELVPGVSRRHGRHQRVATLSEVLSHTSGLTPDGLTWRTSSRNDDDAESEILHDYQRAFSFAEPGRYYGYSNAAFNLTSPVLARKTGEPFPEAMRTLLFETVGMNQTTHDPAKAMCYPLAQHHVYQGNQLRVLRSALLGSKWQSGSQCWSNLAEMSTFGAWLLNDLRPQSDTPPPRVDTATADLQLDIGTRYGFGCYISPSPAGYTVGHEGFHDGMWAKVIVEPASSRGLVWLDNRGDELREARYKVIEKILPNILPRAARRAENSAIVGGIEGTYSRLGSADITVSAMNEGVSVTSAGHTKHLQPASTGLWATPADPQDKGIWRPHAGSESVCLGYAHSAADETAVVHLNALPYVKRQQRAKGVAANAGYNS